MLGDGKSVAAIAAACDCSKHRVNKELAVDRQNPPGKKRGAKGRAEARAPADACARNSSAGKKAVKKIGKKVGKKAGKKAVKSGPKPLTAKQRRERMAADLLAGKKQAFLAAYSKLANIGRSCEAAGVSRSSYYRWVNVDDPVDGDKRFIEAVQHARETAIDAMEAEAHRRAVDGVTKYQFYKGNQVMIQKRDSQGRGVLGEAGELVMIPYIEQEYSDSLLNTMLRAERPDKYADRSKSQVDNTHSMDGETRKAIGLMTPDERAARLTELLDNIRKVGG